jgi:hypothetical protein
MYEAGLVKQNTLLKIRVVIHEYRTVGWGMMENKTSSQAKNMIL